MATADLRKDVVPAPSADSKNSAADAATRLQHQLKRLAKRRNATLLFSSVVIALGWGAGIVVIGMLAYRFYLIDGEPWMPVALLAAALTIGYRNGHLKQRGLFAAAQDADLSLGTGDRLSSALAFIDPSAIRSAGKTSPAASSKWKRLLATLFPRQNYRDSAPPTPTTMVPALVHDAATRAEQIDPRTIYPLRFNRPVQVLLSLGVLLIALSLMPNIEWFRSQEQRQLAKTLAIQGQELEALAKQIKREEPQKPDARAQQLAKRLENLGRRMQRGRMDKHSALLSLGELKRDLEKAQSQQSQPASPDVSRFAEALRNENFESAEGRQMQEELGKGDFEKAAQQMEKLADKIDKGDISQQKREQAARDMEKTAKSLKQQGGEQNEDAARQLEEAAKSLRSQNGTGQQKQQGQEGKQGQEGQSQQGQHKQGQQKQGQNGQSQAGDSRGQSGSQKQQSGGQGNSGASDALRKMAKGLREGGTQSGNSRSMREMLDKIRKAEKETGSNSGNQSGLGQPKSKGQEGQGSQEGQGQEKSSTPGEDLQPSNPSEGTQGGAGLGPRHNIKGAQQKGGGLSDRKTNRTGEKRRWGDVWSDRLPKTRQKLDRITGQMGNNGDVEQLPTRTEAKGGQVRTPYYEVYDSYKKDAEDAISKESVPPAYQKPVKEYFESLKP